MRNNKGVAVAELIETMPLAQDEHGVYRVGGTRVTLDLVLAEFRGGSTAEEIASQYATLRLSDVYQVIGYYLKHQTEMDQYTERRAREQQALLAAHPEWHPDGLRDRLLARQANR